MLRTFVAADKNTFTLKEYLDSVVETRPGWLDLQIVNRDGDAVLAQSLKPPSLKNAAVKILKDQAERENKFVISAEESPDEKLHFFSLAQPVGDGNFVVARVDATSANEVFENLDLRAGNIIAVFDRNNRLIYRNRAVAKQILLELVEMPLFSMSKDIKLIEGFFGFGLLIALQFIITWLSVRFDWVKNLVKAEPTLLFDRGEFLNEVMIKQRVTEGEIRSAIRAGGFGTIEKVEAVILETDGSFSVIDKEKTDVRSAFKDVS